MTVLLYTVSDMYLLSNPLAENYKKEIIWQLARTSSTVIGNTTRLKHNTYK